MQIKIMHINIKNYCDKLKKKSNLQFPFFLMLLCCLYFYKENLHKPSGPVIVIVSFSAH